VNGRQRGQSGTNSSANHVGLLPPFYSKGVVEKLFGSNQIPKPTLLPNPGLIFDRYLCIWQSNTKLCQNRGQLLARFVDEYRKLGQSTRVSHAPQEINDRLQRA
jgi:hypothetical protein